MKQVADQTLSDLPGQVPQDLAARLSGGGDPKTGMPPHDGSPIIVIEHEDGTGATAGTSAMTMQGIPKAGIAPETPEAELKIDPASKEMSLYDRAAGNPGESTSAKSSDTSPGKGIVSADHPERMSADPSSKEAFMARAIAERDAKADSNNILEGIDFDDRGGDTLLKVQFAMSTLEASLTPQPGDKIREALAQSLAEIKASVTQAPPEGASLGAKDDVNAGESKPDETTELSTSADYKWPFTVTVPYPMAEADDPKAAEKASQTMRQQTEDELKKISSEFFKQVGADRVFIEEALARGAVEGANRDRGIMMAGIVAEANLLHDSTSKNVSKMLDEFEKSRTTHLEQMKPDISRIQEVMERLKAEAEAKAAGETYVGRIAAALKSILGIG